MSQATINLLVLIMGAAGFAYVMKTEQPSRRHMWWSGALSGSLTLLYIVARRHFPFESQIVTPRVSLWAEAFVGGTPLIALPSGASLKIAGAAVWLVAWAMCLTERLPNDDV